MIRHARTITLIISQNKFLKKLDKIVVPNEEIKQRRHSSECVIIKKNIFSKAEDK